MKPKSLRLHISWVVVFAAAMLFLPTGKAHAYLDPGSGSLLIQILVAGFLGALLTVRVFWQRIVGLFRGNKASGADDESPGTGVG